MKIPKINTINYALPWLGSGILIGAGIPLLLYVIIHIICWPLCVIGGVILGSFLVVFAIEMRQDFGKTPHYKKHLSEEISFDPDTQYPVLRCSICTGEQIAGFKNKETGAFTEVLVIRSQEDLELFKNSYHIDDIKKEY